ncbi:MAG: response regulator, partial [Kiritimatiellae bacterium]|nr:response regulator [Kiritimatiellia bacterium]
MVIHLIINSNQLPGRMLVAARGAREYHRFLNCIFTYYVTDACWGVFAGLGWTSVLYVDTVVYFIAIAVSVLAWCHFVSVYLDLSSWKARILTRFGYALLVLYSVMLVVNVFNGCFFHFDEHGNYVVGPLRSLIFDTLVVLDVLMGVFALVRARSSQGSVRRRNLVVFLFCVTMAVAVVLQIAWPLWPFYALGCLVGNCFFHVFVVEDERDKLRLVVFEREQAAKHMAELEKALERARAAEKARSMFFSIVSHDIRTPLNAILGYSELLQNGTAGPAERDEALKSISASGTTLLQLVNDVLDLAKMDAGKLTLHLEPVQLARLTDEVFASFRLAASGKGIELVNRAADVPTVMLDAHRFRQILFNLVGNAVKFTARGSVTVAASYSGSNLEVSVSDTGCGIPSDMLSRILDPFVQVQDASHSADRAMGTGLGLSICRSLVEMMGGEFVVESELGKGSTFRARIPGVATSEGTAGAAAEPEPAAVAVKPPKRVLVVDDSPVNRAVLTAFLKRAGAASVEHACDGGEALAKLDSAAKAGSPHDFVFSDFWMPNVNGLEFVEKLRADPRFGDLPVFAVTADTEARDDPRSRLFTGILLKPLTYGKLL